MTEHHAAASSEPAMWRLRNDTSDLAEPRVLIRVFLAPGALEESVGFYEKLQGVAADGRFDFGALRLATVGGFLLIEGGDEDLAPFRSTTGTLLVDDVRPYYDRLVAAGAEIVFPLQEVPTGAAFNARHPDGTVVEYVHHRPTPQGR
ncbi:VOC family protein [Streptomyces johnsoniae]|uniref:VOC family protein n=1 Tax=Streptomyces johnsoniae TaxID=3075532 RepID=A0ABU2S9K7_9ACTN|nr:VOC family protein [Streptomyces sp. DSM 41886]MDT0445603.1 VOC family protein [Streptomyces sp. DSM 41886]